MKFQGSLVAAPNIAYCHKSSQHHDQHHHHERASKEGRKEFDRNPFVTLKLHEGECLMVAMRSDVCMYHD